MKRNWKIILWITIPAILFGTVGMILLSWHCHRAVIDCRSFCYSDIGSVPEMETALLLGAAKIAPSGNPNLYFSGRIEAAVKLFKAGKIRHILISGDNSRKDYDEPTDMKNALMEYGIPEYAVTLDFAGFRTLDSVVRAKTVFGKDKYIVITQVGHAERAVYIARKYGIDAIAFYAGDTMLVKRNRRRERYARIAAWLDVNILCRKPTFEK